MANRKTAARRKQITEQIQQATQGQQTTLAIPETAAQQPAERIIRDAAQTTQQPTPLRSCIVKLDHKGNTVDVAAVPLVTAMRVIQAGQAMSFDRDLAYNVLNGIVSPEVADTTNKQVWSGVPKPSVTAFRKLRYFMQHGKASETGEPIVTMAHGGSAIEWLRTQWDAYVSEKIAANKAAKADGKKTVYRVRPISLQVLAKFLKGDAPKGGGINGLKEKVRKGIAKLRNALNAAKAKSPAITAALKELEAEVSDK